MSHDRIEREIIIDAPRERVWAVLTEPNHVSCWFGDSAEIDLRPGGRASFGWSTEGGVIFRAVIEQVEPPSCFSYRWAHEPGEEPAAGSSTLVEFTLSEQGPGTLLRVVETGFASLTCPADQQQKAADENTEGWASELAELREHAERPPA